MYFFTEEGDKVYDLLEKFHVNGLKGLLAWSPHWLQRTPKNHCMQVEYLSAISPMKTKPNTNIKGDRSVCSLSLQHSFSLSDQISLLYFILRCSDNIYLWGKKKNKKEKGFILLVLWLRDSNFVREIDEQSSLKSRVWVICSTLCHALLWQRKERITLFETALRWPNDESLHFHSTTPAYPPFYKR